MMTTLAALFGALPLAFGTGPGSELRVPAYLFPGTVAANVAFGPRQCGERLRPEQIASLLDRVGLFGYQERDVSNLSGGEAQRVSLARTLANAPEALLLDEPASASDWPRRLAPSGCAQL